MRIKQRKLPKLEDIFELDEQFLLSPHAGAWRPALICGRRLSDGSTVVLKYWKKARTSIDADLRDLWRREVRHAERLRARPGADDLLVPMLEASEADDAFYVVMPGEWVPLKVKLRDCSPQHWCRGLQLERHRQILWRNLRRLVQGLDVIHAQRVVHGGLDEDVVFTASDHEADFRNRRLRMVFPRLGGRFATDATVRILADGRLCVRGWSPRSDARPAGGQ